MREQDVLSLRMMGLVGVRIVMASLLWGVIAVPERSKEGGGMRGELNKKNH